MCPETKGRDLVLARFVKLRELGTKVILGDVGLAGVEDIAVENRATISFLKTSDLS